MSWGAYSADPDAHGIDPSACAYRPGSGPAEEVYIALRHLGASTTAQLGERLGRDERTIGRHLLLLLNAGRVQRTRDPVGPGGPAYLWSAA